MFTWFLLMVLTTPVQGVPTITVLNKFETEAECTTERDRISLDMEAAYPGDTSYKIECRTKPQKQVQS